MPARAFVTPRSERSPPTKRSGVFARLIKSNHGAPNRTSAVADRPTRIAFRVRLAVIKLPGPLGADVGLRRRGFSRDRGASDFADATHTDFYVRNKNARISGH